MGTGNIIAVYNKNQQVALSAFASLMENTNQHMNCIAQQTEYFKNCDAKRLEMEVVSAMKEQCCRLDVIFTPEDIQLVSGQRFPDIIAGKHFGVEVKSTKENKWTSTGSSIVESTRVEDVEHIYILFGKFGGSHVEFKCRPYQDCLYDIAVTHSPRYLIDMNITKTETIFSKMGVDYDKFRLSDNPIESVREYYVKKIKERGQSAMPWWIGKDTVVSPTLRIWSAGTIPMEEQNIYKAEMLILFPIEICQSSYNRATLWLCVRHSVINTHFRDLYTAGGKKEISGVVCPAIIGRIIQLAPLVRELVDKPYLSCDIEEYNPQLFQSKDKYLCWVAQIAGCYPDIVPLSDWLLSFD